MCECCRYMRTRWKRKKGVNIIGKRFFDAGEFGLGYFTIEKCYTCKEYCKNAQTPNGSRWFKKEMVVIETDSGLRYKVPFIPWAKVVDENGKKLSDYYNEQPW